MIVCVLIILNENFNHKIKLGANSNPKKRHIVLFRNTIMKFSCGFFKLLLYISINY